ncbi:MAG: ATP-dependent DNA ligase [Candidatus Micrarchaeia archaeon]
MLFDELAEYYKRLEEVSSRLEMVKILGELFKKVEKNEIKKVVYMTQGVLLPPFAGLEFGIADQIMIEALTISTGYSKEEIKEEYKKTGDLGSVAEDLIRRSKLKKLSNKELEISDVYDAMYKIAEISGQGSKNMKIKGLAGLISAVSPLGARYLIRYPLGELRLGVGDSTILSALAYASGNEKENKEALENAYNLCSDLGVIAEKMKSEGMQSIINLEASVFSPIRPALAERLPTAEAIIEKMNGKCAVEHKYDGFRCQVHKKGDKIEIFSRRLENTTKMLPDIVNAAKKEVEAEEAIFEGEALAFNDTVNEFYPFQETIQRKRKHNVESKAEELPLTLFAFDLMYLNGKSYMSEPYEKRREKLESILKVRKRIIPTTRIITDSPKELDNFFNEAIASGLEGIVAKALDAPYVAGARKFSWIKLKRSYKRELFDSLDLVIVGYYNGKGSRTEFGLGGLLCATYNDEKDVFETISKIGTGFTEEQMTGLNQLLKKIRTDKKPARVVSIIEPDYWTEPKYVVTVNADEITRSPIHTCGLSQLPDGTMVGYALRFPRIINEGLVREDKGPEEATTTKEIIEMFEQQKKVSVEDK